MTTDNSGAYQEMAAVVRAVVASQAVADIVGYTPELRYADTNANAAVPNALKLWMRFTMANSIEKQRTIGRQCRIRYSGVASIQLFVPITDPKAAERIRKVAEKLKSAFAISTANVDFYKAGISDLPPDASWLYKRVSAEFQYTQIQGV